MMNNKSLMEPIIATSVADAWTEVFRRLMHPGITEIAPLHVTIEGLDNAQVEDQPQVRKDLDNYLRRRSQRRDTHTVANTLFPISLWNKQADRRVLYERFLKHVWPAIRHETANRRGHYFQRLVQFDEGPTGNQLEHIIETWTQHHNHRHSALQAAVFDPRRDHAHNRRLGFPCLHQVCFTPLGPNGCEGLAVTGFYATQHVVTKAYGNYLGLIRLGQFMAHEIGLQLRRMTCLAGLAKLGDKITREDVRPLHDKIFSSTTRESGQP